MGLKGKIVKCINPSKADFGRVFEIKSVTPRRIRWGKNGGISTLTVLFYETHQKDFELVQDEELPLLLGQDLFIDEAIGKILKEKV